MVRGREALLRPAAVGGFLGKLAIPCVNPLLFNSLLALWKFFHFKGVYLVLKWTNYVQRVSSE